MQNGTFTYVPDTPGVGGTPREWRQVNTPGHIKCPEGFCHGLRSFSTEWDAADHYNTEHSVVRIRYRCPTCTKWLGTYEEANPHIRENSWDEKHHATGVVDMVVVKPNGRYDEPKHPPSIPRENRT